MRKFSDEKISARSGQDDAGAPVLRKSGAFFGLFSSSKVEAQEKKSASPFKEPVFKRPPLNASRADLAAVRQWAALEEEIVHDYRGQKTVLSESPSKQPLPAFETFTTQTDVPSSARVPGPRGPFRGSGKVLSGVAGFFLVCGWLVAGVLVFLYVQGTFSSREVAQRLVQLQNEKKQLERAYAEMKNVLVHQSSDVQWLNVRLHEVTSELTKAKSSKAVSEQTLEGKYRGELMSLTVRYESELNFLRGALQVQEAIVKALKAQGQAFDKIVDQAGVSALSGAASGISGGSFSAGGRSSFPGEVTSVNDQQGSVVINLGSEQGARTGRRITILRNGVRLAAGRIDRVYPTMSVALVRDASMLQMIEGGDSVSFS